MTGESAICPKLTLGGSRDKGRVSLVERLFAVKARQPGHAVPLIAADLEQAAEAASLDARARRVAETFWPGPLSLILDAKPGVCRDLLAADGSVAVRVPDHDIARALARQGIAPCRASASCASGDVKKRSNAAAPSTFRAVAEIANEWQPP